MIDGFDSENTFAVSESFVSNGGNVSPFSVNPPSHKLNSIIRFALGVRRFIGGEKHSLPRKGFQTWRRSIYSWLSFFLVGFLLGLAPFGEFEDVRSPDYSFEVNRPPILDVKEDIVVDKVELPVVKRENVKERLGQVLRLVPPPHQFFGLLWRWMWLLQKLQIFLGEYDDSIYSLELFETLREIRADTLQRQGKYPPPKGDSEYPGLDCSGIIELVGKNVSRWKVGDQCLKWLLGFIISNYCEMPWKQR
ncbi:hypothetical protein L2E82_18682 [Cichorium intybus]|uniref:Uncharacterized protein n=1 Tax=Cichorium intybus TaxID=13427 RepID=A0ACB9FBJ3_CICIN|nr:hypothetical protein L2E82_18682 [Cichorium intybus]